MTSPHNLTNENNITVGPTGPVNGVDAAPACKPIKSPRRALRAALISLLRCV